VIRDLGDGLILRAGTPGDGDALVAWGREAFREPDGSEDSEILPWIRDLVEGEHPTFRPEYWRIVEEPGTGRIVSALCLIPQTWAYRAIEIPVGRVEIVATLPEFRRRGLIGVLMDEIHALSADMGHLMQVIEGIPWFYRRFGYEMAVPLHGNRRLPRGDVPALKDGEEERFGFRPAADTDLPLLTDLFAEAADRYLITCRRDLEAWRLELGGRSEGGAGLRVIEVIERGGVAVGFVVSWPAGERTSRYVMGAELVEGVSWGEVGPALFRHMAATSPEKVSAISLQLGDEHPLYDAMWHLLGDGFRPYAWYARVPDVTGFLRRVAPVLEWRLAESAFDGHTGEVKISWFDGGVRLLLERGLISVEEWAPTSHEDGDLGFPGMTFLSLLFGRRSLRELREAHPDCVAYAQAAMPLADALFPKWPSWVYGID